MILNMDGYSVTDRLLVKMRASKINVMKNKGYLLMAHSPGKAFL